MVFLIVYICMIPLSFLLQYYCEAVSREVPVNSYGFSSSWNMPSEQRFKRKRSTELSKELSTAFQIKEEEVCIAFEYLL